MQAAQYDETMYLTAPKQQDGLPCMVDIKKWICYHISR